MLLVALVAAVSGAPVAGARTLVSYEVTGGFAGTSDIVTVSTTGVVRSADRRGRARDRLSEARLGALRRALRDARFSTLKRRYAPKGVVNDGLVQTVRHAGRTVVVETGGRPPARLRRLLARLDALRS